MNAAPIHVLAGILCDATGRVLLAQRPPGKPLAGLWEFPGGKRDPSESRLAALARELLEELGIEVHDAQPLAAVTHPYPDATIRLDAWIVTRWTGEPRGLDSQSLAWVPISELDDWPMPAADRPIVTALRLPAHYAITPEPDDDLADFCRRFERAVAGGLRLVQLRCKRLDDDSLRPLAARCAAIAERHGADLLLNDRPALALELGVGLHLPARTLAAWVAAASPDQATAREAWLPRDSSGVPAPLDASPNASRIDQRPQRQARGWLSASCHDANELALAARLGCDFATLSPVRSTTSHPDASPLGWAEFARLGETSLLPLFALGGLTPEHEELARLHGARGIAGIRAFWPP